MEDDQCEKNLYLWSRLQKGSPVSHCLATEDSMKQNTVLGRPSYNVTATTFFKFY